MSNRNWALLISLAVIWGASFFFGRIAVLEIPPFTVVFFRVFIAAVSLWIFVALTARTVPLTIRFAGSMAVLGLINNAIPFSFILYGQTEIGSGLAALVNAMTPIWTLIIANFTTSDERFTANKIVGIAFGFLGVGVMMGSDIVNGLYASALAQGSVLLATVSYAVASIYAKRLKSYDPISISTGQLTASSILMLPIVLLVDFPWTFPAPSGMAIFSVAMIAVVCTALAYILYFEILSSAGATFVSLVTFLVPVSAIMLGVLLLGELLTLGQILGMVLIAIGLIAVDGRIVKVRA